ELGRQRGELDVLAELQRLDEGDDGPAVPNRELLLVARHESVSLLDDAIQAPRGVVAETRLVQRGRRPEPHVLRDLRDAVPELSVARGAEDAIAILTTGEQRPVDLDGDVGEIAAFFEARDELGRTDHLIAVDRSPRRVAHDLPIREEATRLVGLVAELVDHALEVDAVVVAGGGERREPERQDQRKGAAAHCGRPRSESSTRSGRTRASSSRVRSGSKRGSVPSTRSQKRSTLDVSNPSTSNTGSQSFTRRPSTRTPKKAVNEASSTPISKVMGTNASGMCGGRPPTSRG